MKFCIDYTPDSKQVDTVDEINVPFNKDKLITLVDFLEQHNEQRSNIYIKDIKECLQFKIVEKLINIKNEYSTNYAIKFSEFNEDLPFEAMKEADVKFYFNIYVSKWEDLYFLLDLGVSDIYITEELGFELNKVRKVCGNQVQIRVFPNIAQRSWAKLPALKSFFIRPEDIEKYEPYIDVLEIYGDRKKHDVLYKIYKSGKQWFGKLDEIILDFNSDLDSRFITPRFVDKRIRCGRQCLKGGKCRVCDHIEALSKNLENAQLMIKIKEANQEEDERSDSEERNNE